MSDIHIIKDEEHGFTKSLNVGVSGGNSGQNIGIKSRGRSASPPLKEKEVSYDQSDVDLFSKMNNQNEDARNYVYQEQEEESDDGDQYEEDTYGYEEESEDGNEYMPEQGSYNRVEKNNYTNKLSPEQTKAKKANLLWKINKLNNDGRYSTALLDMESDVNTIENEYYRIEKQIENESGVELVKQGYVGMSSFIEFFSTRQKIVALNMTGWTYKVAIDSNQPRYEKVFSQIYDKYLSQLEASDPLLTLAWLTVSSAASYHCSQASTITNEPDRKEEPVVFRNETKYQEEMEDPDDDLDDIINKLNSSSSRSNGLDPDILTKEKVDLKKIRGRPKKNK